MTSGRLAEDHEIDDESGRIASSSGKTLISDGIRSLKLIAERLVPYAEKVCLGPKRSEVNQMSMIRSLPSRLGFTRIWRKFHNKTVPVLLLHGVLPDADTSPFNSTGKFISPVKLRTFLERVARIFKVVSADDLVRYQDDPKRLENSLVITFDDGYSNNYEYAFPLLQSMGLPFTVFVATGFLDSQNTLWNDRLELAIFTTSKKEVPASILSRVLPIETPGEKLIAISALKDALKRKPLEEASHLVDQICIDLGLDPNHPKLADVRFMTTQELKKMADAGVTIGSHGVSHAILSLETDERVWSEITDSKTVLEGITGMSVTLFAYPNGRREDFDERTKRALRRAGYLAAFTTIHGLHSPNEDLFEIKRISWDNRWSYHQFETHVTGILGALSGLRRLTRGE